ncbi:putative lipoprotein [Burkholderia pseudomallei Pakistan 9]|nr:putative lipoprotein [Burkholderia pseudomallei Pakistan 9]
MHTLRIAQVEQRVAGSFGASSAVTGCSLITGRCGSAQGSASLTEAVSIIGSFHARRPTGTADVAYTWRGTRCRFARRRRRSDRRVPRGMPDGDCELPGTVVRGAGSRAAVRNPPFRCDCRTGRRKLPAKSIDDETRGEAIVGGLAPMVASMERGLLHRNWQTLKLA